MEWGRRAVARAYAAGASDYAERFAGEFSHNDFDRDLIRRFLDPLPPGTLVLDGGCGPGQFARLASDVGLAPVGVDITFEMLAIAREHLVQPRLACADLCALPLKSGALGSVVCWFAVHNLPRLLMPDLLAEIRRVLVDGGRLLIGTHEGTREERFTDDEGETFSFTYYSNDELAGLLDHAGFESITSVVRPPHEGEHQVHKLFVSALVPGQLHASRAPAGDHQ